MKVNEEQQHLLHLQHAVGSMTEALVTQDTLRRIQMQKAARHCVRPLRVLLEFGGRKVPERESRFSIARHAQRVMHGM
jgi:hypothetical protein